MDARQAFLTLRFGAKFNSKQLVFGQNEVCGPKINGERDPGNALDNNYEANDGAILAEEANYKNSDGEQESDNDQPFRLTTDVFATTKKEETGKSARKKRIKTLPDEKRREAVTQFRKQKRIYICGSDVPDPCPSFAAMIERHGIPEELANTMRKLFASWTPTPIQMQAIPIMMQGRELLASAPTGSGKTLAFVIPLLSHLRKSQKGGFRAVILEPTRELAKQVYREVLRLNEQLGLRIHMITNSEVAKEKFGTQSKRRLDILVSTPNRLVYLLKEDPPCLDLSKVEWLIVDESDKLFETGTRGFRDQLAIIHQACDESRCRRAFFSATFSYDVEQWCKAYLDNAVTVSIGARNTAAATVEQEMVFVGNEYGKIVAMRNLISGGLMPPVLIFVQTKERAASLHTEMLHNKLKVGVIHSDRDRKERDKVVKRFRTGELWFLICTELMGRGIDFKNVNVVINYDFPPSAISYIHRIGRTGRAGRRGKAITFFTEYDRPLLRSIANVMREAGCPTPAYMLQLKKPRKQLQKQLIKRCAERPNVTILRAPDKHRKRKATSASSKGRKKQRMSATGDDDPALVNLVR